MSVAKKPRKPYTIHGTDILINKDNLKDILDSRDMEFKELYYKVATKYKLDITYKSFMSLMDNRATWKLLYAWAIVDTLGVGMLDIFDVVEIDIEKKIEEKEKWKDQFDPKRKGKKK
ncbi:hypothetical protein AB3N02_21905 [Priestia aryabhattai]|uniref:hypothetical protein n=1 Tax=Priestia aryabhattai TaxID=412384 RepID=UPI0039A27B20